MSLPPPPPSFKVLSPLQSGTDDVVLYERMLEYAAAVREAALEEAAKVCDKLAAQDSTDWHSPICAVAIRSLKDGK